jgi:hypothetical protein
MGQQELTKDELARLLREAEAAHGEYEKTLGRRDDDWPEWYAAFIVEKLQVTKGPGSGGSW